MGVCMLCSFVISANASVLGSIDADDTVTLNPESGLRLTDSPADAFAVGYNMSTKATYYYGTSAAVLTENAEDGIIEEGWTPPGMQTADFGDQVDPNAIIGEDGRTLVTDTGSTPHAAICAIYTIFRNLSNPNDEALVLSTGWLISPNAVVTAGHALHTLADGWAVEVYITPGASHWDIGLAPYGRCKATEIVISKQYYESKDEDHDWGLIRMESNLGSLTGYLGFRSYTVGTLTGYDVYTMGYPDDKNPERQKAWNCYQYQSEGVVTADSGASTVSREIQHNMDTYTGNSGGPVMRSATVIAIHRGNRVTTVNGTTTVVNVAVAFTNNMVTFFRAYKNNS